MWFLICSVLQKGISIISTPIFTRLMSPSEYGTYNVFTSWQGIITAIVILTLPYGVLSQGLVKFQETREKFTSALLGLMSTLTIVWTVIYLVLKEYWNQLFSLTTVQMLAMFLTIWATSVFQFWAMVQRVDYKYRKLVAVTLFTSLAKPVVGILLVLHADDKVTARIMGIAFVELAAYLGLYISMLRKGRTYFDRGIWKYGILFSTPLIPHYLSQRILSSADRIMINRMVSSDAAGIYSLAYQLSQIMIILNQSLTQAIEPWYFRKLKEHREEEIGRIAYSTMLMVAVANLMVIVFAPEIIYIFAPVSYHDSIWVISPIAMSVFFMFLYNFFVDVEFYYENTKWISMATLIAAGMNIVLNYFFIGIFGYYAAGYTTLFCYMAYCIFHYVFMNQVSGGMGRKIFDIRRLLLISAGFLLSGFLITLTYNAPLIRYSIILLLLIVLVLRRRQVTALIRGLIQMRK